MAGAHVAPAIFVIAGASVFDEALFAASAPITAVAVVISDYED